MELQLYPLLLGLLSQLWWPFVRIMAMLAFAPAFGDGMVPMRVRVLLSLTLAITMLPIAAVPPDIPALSMHSLAITLEQVTIGAVIGLALQFASNALGLLGYLISSQTGLSMAVMNDPINGNSSDAVAVLINLLAMLVFFAIDGHLLVIGVVGSSFHAWPIGSALESLHIQNVVFNVGWVFAAAFLLAAPIVFSTLVIQFGFGFLNRVSPTLNLFSLGFSVITMFGFAMLAYLLRFVPEHYVNMTQRSLGMLASMMSR